MNSPYYGNAAKFKPSSNTLYKWLETRKGTNGSKPGIFQTVNYSSDSGWTLIAFLIEAAAFVLTVLGALEHYSQFHDKSVLIIALVAAFLFIAFDVVGVALHGADKGSKVIAKAKIAITHDPNILKGLIQETDSVTFREFSGIIMMFISAVIKILAIMVLSGNIGLPVMLILCLFYVVVIYIHVAHTGYFLAARKSSKMMKSEEDAWWREESQGLNTPLQPDMIVFTSPSPVPNGTTFQNGRQNLETQERIETDEGVEFHITLTTQGLLWDEDIVALLQNFPTNNLFYPALIRACIQLQFTQLNIVSEPIT